MARFAAVNSANEFVLAAKFMELAVQPPDIPHKDIRWLPCPPVAQPAFDPLTQALNAPTYTVEATQVLEVWTVRTLQLAETEAAKDQAIDNALNGSLYTVLLKALLLLENDNRLIKSKMNALITATGATTPPFTAGQANQITMAQLKTALKALL